ncbi:NAD(P)-binding protein, partial [Candidatus Parcubacteria bacterium]|nr:NAD(P)-binding protein [Candidatus Parcubacteria bacterium]
MLEISQAEAIYHMEYGQGEERMPAFKALDGDIEADICIVGAGLAGVWCSYLLSKEGKKIVLIKKKKKK